MYKEDIKEKSQRKLKFKQSSVGYKLISIVIATAGIVLIATCLSGIIRYCNNDSKIEVEALMTNLEYHKDTDDDGITQEYYKTNIEYTVDNKKYTNVIKLADLPDNNPITINVDKENPEMVVDSELVSALWLGMFIGAMLLLWSADRFLE